MAKVNPKIYDIIYSNDNTPGYDRYLRYAKAVKKQEDPLKYLSKEEPTYYPVYSFLKGKEKLEILEVGCGYGYLTYSLHSAGHNILGIDISKNAIKFAESNFGDYYKVADLKDYKANKKFDLIISTEVIEHLTNPVEFIDHCLKLLKPNGKIILTTPSKDYYNKKVIWKTDLPPVHTVWFSRSSFRYIAKQRKLKCDFINFNNYVGRNENTLVDFIYTRLTSYQLPMPVLNKKGKAYQKRVERSNSFFRMVFRKIIFFAPVRYICAYVTKVITKENCTLSVVLEKNLK